MLYWINKESDPAVQWDFKNSPPRSPFMAPVALCVMWLQIYCKLTRHLRHCRGQTPKISGGLPCLILGKLKCKSTHTNFTLDQKSLFLVKFAEGPTSCLWDRVIGSHPRNCHLVQKWHDRCSVWNIDKWADLFGSTLFLLHA